jgi:peptidyl-prolyl cis-trans isomerase B (cyclophilin B)
MNLRKIKKYLLPVITLVFLMPLSGCGKAVNSASDKQKDTSNTQSSTSNTSTTPYKSKYSGKKPIVTIEMEDGAKLKVELYPDTAPKTVDNFISLVQKNFYDGLIFHRVIPDFMIQGGDPQGVGTGGPGYNIPGEFKSNNFDNPIKHTRGVISMARSQDPNSAGSQFFIMVKDTPQLDGDYAAFGKVTQGIEEVDKIVSVKRDANDKPLSPQKMKKVTVDIQ